MTRPFAREMAQAGGGRTARQAGAAIGRSWRARRALARAILRAHPERSRR